MDVDSYDRGCDVYAVNPRYNESKEPGDLVRYIEVFVIMRYDERLFIDKSASQISPLWRGIRYKGPRYNDGRL